jgi:hypothetical protein
LRLSPIIESTVAGDFAKNPMIKYFHSSIYAELSHADFVDSIGFVAGNHHYSLRNELRSLKSIFDEIGLTE